MTTTDPPDPGCWFHGVEPIRPDHVRTCGECGHAFTAVELIRRDLVVRLELDREFITQDLNRAIHVLTTTTDAANEELASVTRSLDLAPDDVARLAWADVDDVTICPLCGHDL